MASWSFKKITTHLMEGAGILSEFWLIGILHELGRRTKYYNGNVNDPRVGDFVTLIFSLFYIARICGNLISLKFAESRRYVFVTYLLCIPAIIATFIAGRHESIYWMVISRCIIGFCTSFAPIQCMIRSELTKGQLVSNYAAVRQGKMDKEKVGRTSGTALTLVETIQFICAYVTMLIASICYTESGKGLAWLQIIWALVILLFLVFFFSAFSFNEPKDHNKNELIQENERRDQKEHRPVRSTRVGNMFKFLLADSDLMYNTIGVKIYESIFMVDFVFSIVMVQTHPYYKGLFMGRISVIVSVCIAAVIALIIGLLFATKIESKNATGYMMTVSLFSIFLYPLSATAVNYFSYKYGTVNFILFGLFAFIKLAFWQMMEEGLRELIVSEHRTKSENFKALGYFVGSICKATSFGVFGWVITKAMRSFRIQKLNPYNYTISFLILALPLTISWFMLRMAKLIKDGQKK